MFLLWETQATKEAINIFIVNYFYYGYERTVPAATSP